jgi:diguanylate cyclase (GGDEF)-like protein
VTQRLDHGSTWLCPTQFDRARLVDMEARLQPARAVLFGSLAVVSAASVPWLGWAVLVCVFAQVASYALVKPFINKVRRPEYPVAWAVVSAQVVIALAVALSGGPRSPVLVVFLVGISALPARFGRTRVVVAGVVLTELLLFLSTAAVDPAAFAANPSRVLIMAGACFGLASFAHALMRAESEQRIESVFDTLTELPNRRGMEAGFEALQTDAAATGSSLALLLCDLDSFKSINDRYGHDRGDAVLRETAGALRACLREGEAIYRIGGEEFLVLLAGCDVDGAVPVAERIRAAIEAAQPGGLPVTVSVGAAAARGPAISFDALFQTADRALYEAKRSGRNRVSADRSAVAEAA